MLAPLTKENGMESIHFFRLDSDEYLKVTVTDGTPVVQYFTLTDLTPATLPEAFNLEGVA